MFEIFGMVFDKIAFMNSWLPSILFGALPTILSIWYAFRIFQKSQQQESYERRVAGAQEVASLLRKGFEDLQEIEGEDPQEYRYRLEWYLESARMRIAQSFYPIENQVEILLATINTSKIIKQLYSQYQQGTIGIGEYYEQAKSSYISCIKACAAGQYKDLIDTLYKK